MKIVFIGDIVGKEARQKFIESIPDIKNEDLVKAGSGVRAQVLSRDGNLLDDFKIQTNNHIVNVLNAPSPAATSSFSIAKSIVKNL